MANPTTNSLEADIWQALDKAAKTPGHAFRWATLGYVRDNAGPVLKTVMLRGLDLQERRLRFFTDARSNKVSALTGSKTPKVSLLFVDLGENIQLSVRGTAMVHLPASDLSTGCFQKLSPRQHLDYATLEAPGTLTNSPEDGDQRNPIWAPGNFAVVDVEVEDMDLVILGEPTRRVAGAYCRDSGHSAATFSGHWLVP